MFPGGWWQRRPREPGVGGYVSNVTQARGTQWEPSGNVFPVKGNPSQPYSAPPALHTLRPHSEILAWAADFAELHFAIL
jgi:hypothetical protein